MSDRPDAGRSLSVADDARRTVHDAGRWFAGYLVAVGAVAVVWIVALEAVFDEGWPRHVASAVGALALGGLAWWAESRAVHPRGARRTMLLATVAWWLAYLFVLGPVVRWQAGTSLGWWTLAAVVLASPFFVAAWWQWRKP